MKDVLIIKGIYKGHKGTMIDQNQKYYFVNIIMGDRSPCVLFPVNTAHLCLEFIDNTKEEKPVE
jgi:ribosomal protein L21E